MKSFANIPTFEAHKLTEAFERTQSALTAKEVRMSFRWMPGAQWPSCGLQRVVGCLLTA